MSVVDFGGRSEDLEAAFQKRKANVVALFTAAGIPQRFRNELRPKRKYPERWERSHNAPWFYSSHFKASLAPIDEYLNNGKLSKTELAAAVAACKQAADADIARDATERAARAAKQATTDALKASRMAALRAWAPGPLPRAWYQNDIDTILAAPPGTHPGRKVRSTQVGHDEGGPYTEVTKWNTISDFADVLERWLNAELSDLQSPSDVISRAEQRLQRRERLADERQRTVLAPLGQAYTTQFRNAVTLGAFPPDGVYHGLCAVFTATGLSADAPTQRPPGAVFDHEWIGNLRQWHWEANVLGVHNMKTGMYEERYA
jgi:hypothetical protein